MPTASPARPAPLLVATAAGAAALVASGALRAGHVRGNGLDRWTRRELGAAWRDRVPRKTPWLGGRETRRHRVADALGRLTSELPTIGLGAVAALLVGRRRGVLAALPVLAAAPAGNAAHGLVKYRVKRRRPLTAALTGKTTPSFPSGHAARGAAATGIAAYVAAREGLAPLALALPAGAALAVVGGGARVYVDRHWATDAVGGWGLGVATAALCALAYDAARTDERP